MLDMADPTSTELPAHRELEGRIEIGRQQATPTVLAPYVKDAAGDSEAAGTEDA